MFEQAVSKKTRENLELLSKSKILPANTYLAGGTALAFYLGHRLSYDLDFFTTHKFQGMVLLKKLEKLKTYRHGRSAEGTILGELGDVKFSLFYYPYPLIKNTNPFNKIQLADMADIAAMKIAAISERGSRKDFIDLYFLCQIYPLDEILEFYEKKYKKLSSNIVHIKKSLVYLFDAEQEAMPIMIQNISWKKIKDFFEKSIKTIEF